MSWAIGCSLLFGLWWARIQEYLSEVRSSVAVRAMDLQHMRGALLHWIFGPEESTWINSNAVA